MTDHESSDALLAALREKAEREVAARRDALKSLAASAGVAAPAMLTLLAADPTRAQDTGLSDEGGDGF